MERMHKHNNFVIHVIHIFVKKIGMTGKTIVLCDKR
jgi:hypothetical protein